MSKFLSSSGTRKYIKLENSYYSKDAPKVQISKVLQEQENMTRGCDLRKWSLSARKTLAGGRSAAFIVPKATETRGPGSWRYEAPKLAMVVASPILRDHFVQNPESTEFLALNPHFTAKAIDSVANWLRIAITVPELNNIHLPKLNIEMSDTDLKDCLNVVLAMRILDMGQYVDDFAIRYQATLVYPDNTLRLPRTTEARAILDHAIISTQDGREEVVDVLAYHLVVIKKKGLMSAEWTAFLTDFRNRMLSDAMQRADARFSEKVKQERKERQKNRDSKRQMIEGASKQDNIIASDASKSDRHTREVKPVLASRKTSNLFDLLAEENE